MPLDAAQMRCKCGAKILIEMNKKTNISIIIRVLIVLALFSVTPGSITTGDAGIDTAPHITGASVDPVKVRLGDTVLVTAMVGGG